MIFDGFAISGYRSFGKNIQYFAPLRKINIIIGQNNSGKSNVLRFLTNHLSEYYEYLNSRHTKISNYSDLDKFIGTESTPTNIGIALNLYSDKAKEKLKKSNVNIQNLIQMIFSSKFVKEKMDCFG